MFRYLLTASIAVAVPALVFGACAGKVVTATGLILVINSNLSSSQYDHIQLEIQQQEPDGGFAPPTYDQSFAASEIALPADFSIQSGTSSDQVAFIQLSALLNGAVVDLRQVQVQVPSNRVAQLELFLSSSCYNKGLAGSASSCGAGQSCQPATGTCGSNEVNIDDVPDATDDPLGNSSGSGGGSTSPEAGDATQRCPPVADGTACPDNPACPLPSGCSCDNNVVSCGHASGVDAAAPPCVQGGSCSSGSCNVNGVNCTCQGGVFVCTGGGADTGTTCGQCTNGCCMGGTCMMGNTSACGPSCTACASGQTCTPIPGGATAEVCVYTMCPASPPAAGTYCPGGTSCPYASETCNCTRTGAGPVGQFDCGGDSGATDAAAPGNPTTLASGLSSPLGIATDGTNVYFTSGGMIESVPVDGGSTNTIFSAGEEPAGLAIDGTSVYWIDVMAGTVVKAPLAGGDSQTLATGQPTGNGNTAGGTCGFITVANENVYWSDLGDGNDGLVLSTPTSGGGQITTIASGQADPQGVAVTPTRVFWGTNNGTGSTTHGVFAAALTGGTATTLVQDGGANYFNLAIDPGNTTLIWTDQSFTTVEAMPIVGGAVVTLAQPFGGLGWGLALDSTYAYWTNSGNLVAKVPLVGGNPTTLVDDADTAKGIAVDSNNVYFTTSSAVMSIPK